MTSLSHSEVELTLAPSRSGGSLTQGKEKKAAESTMFDSDIPEVYYTLDAAQREHNSVASGTDPLYEFDRIVRSVMVGGSEGGSGVGVIMRAIPPEPPSSLLRSRRILEAKNVLYEDNEIPQDTLRHRCLRGNSYSVENGTKAASYIAFRCRTKSLVVAFFTALALLLAVASLGLTTLGCTMPLPPPPPPPPPHSHLPHLNSVTAPVSVY